MPQALFSSQVASVRAENAALSQRVAELEMANSALSARLAETVSITESAVPNGSVGDDSGGTRGKAGLTAAEISRYSRHLLVPGVGVEAQR